VVAGYGETLENFGKINLLPEGHFLASFHLGTSVNPLSVKEFSPQWQARRGSMRTSRHYRFRKE
jgi:hypothetical protein